MSAAAAVGTGRPQLDRCKPKGRTSRAFRPKRSRRRRKPRVDTKQMEKTTGKTVTGVTVAPDGVVTYTFGQPSAEANPWDVVLPHATASERTS